MRLSYVPNPPHAADPEEKSTITAIAARRHPRPLQPLDLTLLHSPPIADGWNTFLGAVRTRSSLPADLRELTICRVAVINQAWYEWMHHAPLAIKSGVSEDSMTKIKDEGALLRVGKPEGFTEHQWAVSVMADEMTRNVRVADETFAWLKGLFSDKEIVEIVATVSIALYLMHALLPLLWSRTRFTASGLKEN